MTYHFDTQAFVRRMEAVGMARSLAEELADALGAVVLDGLGTKRDIDEAAGRTDGYLRELELRLRQELKELKLRVTVRMGAMAAATVAILGALITLK